MVNSKVTGNTSLYSSSAIRVVGGNLTVTQSLVADNSASYSSFGGIDVRGNETQADIRWSTITGNGDGDLRLLSSASANVYGSIVLNTSVSDTAALTYTSSLYQLVSGSGTVSYSGSYNRQLQSGDKLFAGGSDIATKYKLADGSVAINATGIRTTTGNPTVDLAGVARPQGGVYDYGAFEFGPASPAELPYDNAADAAFASLDADDLLADFDLF